MTGYSFSRCLVLYVLFFLIISFPYWGRGEVIAPYVPSAEMAAPALPPAGIENRKFSDYFDAFVPLIAQHQSEPRSGWLALWTGQNELGHPLEHVAGLSPAYLPSSAIAHVTDNPLRFLTILSLLWCFLSGLFVLLFCDEIELHPLAGLIAGVSLAASPMFM